METRLRRLSPGRRQAVAAMVRLVLPAYPDLEESGRSRVETAVADFVASQIESLPTHLAVPYRWALTAFEWIPVLRFGDRFSALEPSAQTSCLKFWSEFPVGPPRDFVKLIRSCSVLAYFDHPEVTARLPGAPLQANGVEDVG